MKTYKKAHYNKDPQKHLKKQKQLRTDNHEHYLQVEAARRLAHSKNPSILLQRRSLAILSDQDRYVHDRMAAWRAAAKKRNIGFLLSSQDVINLVSKQKGRCYYTGRALVFEPNSIDTLSIDRVDSNGEYTTKNVVACGALVNRMKLDLSTEQFKDEIRLLFSRLEDF